MSHIPPLLTPLPNDIPEYTEAFAQTLSLLPFSSSSLFGWGEGSEDLRLSLLPWDLICMSLSCLSKVSEYLSGIYMYICAWTYAYVRVDPTYLNEPY